MLHIKAQRKALADAMTLVTAVVNQRHANPLLQNVLLESAKDGLTLRATDLEISLQCKVKDVSVQKEGKALLSAQRFGAVLKDVQAESVELKLKGDTLELIAERGHISLQTSDAEGFPSFPKFSPKEAAAVPAASLERALSWCGKSIAGEKGRYALNGVLVTPGENAIELCGTDGRRLSYFRIAAKGKKYNFPIIIPRRGIDLLTRLAARDLEGEVMLDIRENELVAKAGDAIASTQLVEGQFPDYWTVIPRGNDKKFVINREQCIGALRLAGHMTSVESQQVTLSVTKSGISMKTRSPGAGSAEVEIGVTYDGDDIKMGFDPRYLQEGLSMMTVNDVTCEARDSNTGTLFHEGDKETLFLLVMPLEVD